MIHESDAINEKFPITTIKTITTISSNKRGNYSYFIVFNLVLGDHNYNVFFFELLDHLHVISIKLVRIIIYDIKSFNMN